MASRDPERNRRRLIQLFEEENNDAGGVPIEKFMRIFADTRARALSSLQRIITPSRDAVRRATQEKVVANAIDEIEEIRAQWRRRRLIRVEPPPSVPEGAA